MPALLPNATAKIRAMRLSQYPITNLKETPAEADIVSQQLMLRAGLIRRLSAGIYTWLPIGLRTLRKVERIIREEMNRAGAFELLMPAIQPAELWQETGRWDRIGAEGLLLRLKDRHDRDYCVGPTHEEVITPRADSNRRKSKRIDEQRSVAGQQFQYRRPPNLSQRVWPRCKAQVQLQRPGRRSLEPRSAFVLARH